MDESLRHFVWQRANIAANTAACPSSSISFPFRLIMSSLRNTIHDPRKSRRSCSSCQILVSFLLSLFFSVPLCVLSLRSLRFSPLSLPHLARNPNRHQHNARLSFHSLASPPRSEAPPRQSLQGQVQMVTVRAAQSDDSSSWLQMRQALWSDDSEAEHREEMDQFFAGQFPPREAAPQTRKD